MSEPVNPLIPHSLDFVGMPWGTRPTEQRATGPTFVPPELRGQMAGTPAYDAGALPKPVPYDWTGGAPVPNEIYAMATDLASAFGNNVGPIPAITDADAFAGWLASVYNGLTAKGEGCGIDHDAIDRAIIENAQLGPHHVAYAIQQLVRTSPLCNEFLIRKPLDPPPTLGPPPRTADQPTTGTIDRATPPAKKSNALKWTLAGVGILAVIGGSIWYMTRAAKKRRNPCSCSNPLVAVGYEEEREENPYSGTRGYSSVDPDVLDLAAPVSPLLVNPSPRRKRRR